MDGHLFRLIDGFSSLNVTVIGEAMLDTYLEGDSDRLSREAPVPVVRVTDRRLAPGGAANTAANVAALGGQPTFLSIIGDDQDGALLRQVLDELGVSTEHLLVDASRHTISKNRVIGSSQMLVRFDQGTTRPLDPGREEALIDRLTSLWSRSDAVIVSDYSYGVLSPRVVEALAELQRRRPRLLIVDSRRLPLFRQVGVTAVKPNYEEVLQLIGATSVNGGRGRVESMMPYAQEILEVTGAEIAAVTLDTDGALLFERGVPPYRTYAEPQPNSHAAGAGDTFISAMALVLAAGANTHSAAEIASAAAAVVVSRNGTTVCDVQELRGYISDVDKYVEDVDLLAARLELYRLKDRRIVFTNGCFDILHRGHIGYLNRAKELGDILVVGVNTDEGVRRLKGPARPINPLEDRVEVLAALSCVDHIVPFGEDTPANLVRAIRPDVFVKGGDYTRERLPEAAVVEELGGRVEILPYLQNRSTTRIIDRIRQASAEAPVLTPAEAPAQSRAKAPAAITED